MSLTALSDDRKSYVPAHLVRAAHQRVAASPEFQNSERLKQFLAYCVDETLVGKQDNLKEALIGVAVFGRPPGFDSRADPIVRVDARRLRAKLDEYYRMSGAGDPVRIAMPVGQYGLTFEAQGCADPSSSAIESALSAGVPIVPAAPAAATGLAVLGGRSWWWAAVLLPVASILVYWTTQSDPDPGANRQLVRVTSDRGVTTDPDVTRDGKWLAFASDRDTGSQLAIYVQPAKGAARRLTFEEWHAVEPSLSPDGSWVAYRSQRPGGGIYVVPSTGGTPRQVASEGWRPRVSPDGQWILYSAQSQSLDYGQIWVVAAGGGAPHRLVSGFATAQAPVWNDDGSQIVFYGTWVSGVPERERDYWVVPFPTGEPRKLGFRRDFERVYEQSWLANAIYFCLDASGHDALYRQRLRNGRLFGAPERLIDNPGYVGRPAVSADKVYFAALDWSAEIAAVPMDTDTGRVTGPMRRAVAAQHYNSFPSVDALETRLAYLASSGDYDSQASAWRDLANGVDHPAPKSPLPAFSDYPVISPDGRRLAVRGRKGPRERPIWILDLDKGGYHEVCADCGGPTGWSADGEKLLYEPGATVAYAGLLEIGARRSRTVLRHPEFGLRRATFSPDGQWIAFQLEVSGNRRQVFTARPDAHPADWNPVTNGHAYDVNPAWSPNGRLLYFLSNRDGFECIWAQAMDPKSGRPAGEAFAIQHLHRAARLMRDPRDHLGPAVGPRNIYFTIQPTRSDIWSMSLP